VNGILDLFGTQEDEVEPEPLPDEPRARFAELLRRHHDLKKPDMAFSTSAQERMENEILAHHDAKFPKSKVTVPQLPEKRPDGTRDRSLVTERWHAVRALGNKISDTLVDGLLAKYSAEIDEHNKTRREAAEPLLKEAGALVESLDPRPGSEWTKTSEVWETAYGSQGGSAPWYAHGSAELRALVFQKMGLEVEVRECGEPIRSYAVWVKADPLDIEIAKWKSPFGIQDAVREAHRRGLNPRVYYPTLEHGAEQAWGITAQGGVALGEEVRFVKLPKPA
jgi:hypothetical protein